MQEWICSLSAGVILRQSLSPFLIQPVLLDVVKENVLMRSQDHPLPVMF